MTCDFDFWPGLCGEAPKKAPCSALQDLKETLLDSVHRISDIRQHGIRQAEVKVIKTPEAEWTDFGDEFPKFVDHAEHNAEHI